MKKLQQNIHSGTILKAIEAKHSKDLFVPECRTGASQCSSFYSRFDAWVMRKSWAHPCTTGYEIKVTRKDFLNDHKWVDYLPFCNELYFACPPDVIKVSEVSDDVGLYWTTANGTKLYLKKKAKYRDIQIPDSVFRYILMWRTKLTSDTEKQDNKKFWEEWLINRSIDRSFGYRVGKAIKEELAKKITSVEDENTRLKRLMTEYDSVRDTLKSMGINPESFDAYDIRMKTKAVKLIPRDMEFRITDIINRLNDLLGNIKEIQSGLKTD